MSVCITIRTEKKITSEDMFKEIEKAGVQISCASNVFPFLKFGKHKCALRGIEVTEEENGYDISVCTFASDDDYRLFILTIDVILKMTQGHAFLDNEYEIKNPLSIYNEKWIQTQKEQSFRRIKALTHYFGEESSINGLYHRIHIGTKVLNSFDIYYYSDYSEEKMNAIQDYLIAKQWNKVNIKDNQTNTPC